MTLEINLLVVEDDQIQLKNWAMEIEKHNASGQRDFSVKLYTETNKDSALTFIDKNSIDAAIIDVRLGAEQNQHGGEVLLRILESELAVAVILSGESGAETLLPEFNKKVKNIVKGSNGSGIRNTMNWLKDQIPMIKQIKSVEKDIKKEMVNLFSHSIWPRWDKWINSDAPNAANDTFIRKALTRHLTAYIYASFLEKTEQKVHPEEWYFVPPIRKGIRTGDIIKNDNNMYEIVITPRCDLARDEKNETYQLVECKIVTDEWQQLCQTLREKQNDLQNNTNPGRTESLQKKVQSAKNAIRKFTQHSDNSSIYHFLPELKIKDDEIIGPFLVQFDKLRSIRRSNEGVKSDLINRRVAAVAPEFLPSLIERLGAFFSRFGTPDYSHHD